MKKEVMLCEDCYVNGKEIVANKCCLICSKSICNSCIKEITIKISTPYNFNIKNLNVTPLCPNCVKECENYNQEFWQKTVNFVAKLIVNHSQNIEDNKELFTK